MINRILHKTLVLSFAVVCVASFTCAEIEGVKYKVKIKGAKNGVVKKAIKESTVTWKLQKRPPSTIGQLRRRIEKDLPVIEAILEANGYYDGTMLVDIDTERKPLRVYLRVDQGKPYRFRSVDLQYTGDPDPELEKIKLMLRRKKKVTAVAVFTEQQRVLDLMKRKGYPFPTLERRTVEVDHTSKEVDLVLAFDPGKVAFFGPVQIDGLKKLPRKYIKRQLPWREGDKYDAKEVADFEKKMLGTGLFGSVRMSPLEGAYTNTIPISVQLSERSQRTIRLGVNYSDIGPGAKLYWEHRSLLGQGERLETSLMWNPIKYGSEVKFTRTGFLDANQSFVFDLNVSEENSDAYDSRQARGTGMVLRDFTSNIQGGIGLGYKYSLVEQLESSKRFGHVIFPLQAIFDYRNDPLNPERGGQLFGRTAFYENTIGPDNFLKTQLEGRKYFMLWNAYRLSSAMRVTVGSIDGAGMESIPANERFYAGGGGSIRGYEYQAVGPRQDGTPTGGDKLLEFSVELRLKPGRRLGYAAFVDGGMVYDDFQDDELNRSLRYGVGMGLRWFTTIGPLRVDLAYPLNPDSGQVERLQFYISLGQSF